MYSETALFYKRKNWAEKYMWYIEMYIILPIDLYMYTVV